MKIPTAVTVIAALIDVLALAVIICRMYFKKLTTYCDRELVKLYFYGHPLNRVIGRQFFIRYRKFVDIGFCAAVSALMMMAFKENRTARIVRGYQTSKYGEKFFHSWVEFRYLGIWFVIDPCLITGFSCLPRLCCRLLRKTQIVSICKHAEFWSLPISQQFFEKLQKPQSSQLFYEIFVTYGWMEETDAVLQHAKGHNLPEKAGARTSPGVVIYYNEWFLTKRIFNEFMAKPTRKHAKAHTIRYFKHLRKGVRRDYRNFLQKKYGDPNHDAYALP